jgi:hypothetical protein
MVARRLLLLTLVAFSFIAFAPGALAAGELLAQNEGPVPAIEVGTEPAEEAAPAWTYRYLIPTFLVLAGVVVVATVVLYFVKVVRSRYRVVP